MPRRWVDDDEPAPIGADPDRPRTQTGGKQQTPTGRLLDFFVASWDAARRDDDDRLPPRPYSTGNAKRACNAWLKNTFLPSVNGDVELGEAIIDLFCQQVAAGVAGWAYNPNPERGAWDLWKHLSPRVEPTRQLLIDRGWKSAADREREARQAEHRASRRQESVAAQVDKVSAKEEWIKSREGLSILIPFTATGAKWAHYEWLLDEQTVDYSDWVTVPWDDGLPRYGRVTYEEWLRKNS